MLPVTTVSKFKMTYYSIFLISLRSLSILYNYVICLLALVLLPN